MLKFKKIFQDNNFLGKLGIYDLDALQEKMVIISSNNSYQKITWSIIGYACCYLKIDVKLTLENSSGERVKVILQDNSDSVSIKPTRESMVSEQSFYLQDKSTESSQPVSADVIFLEAS